MQRLVIAIDFDDVLVPTAEAVIKNYNDRFGNAPTLDQYYAREASIWGAQSLDEAIARVNDFLTTEEYAAIPPFEAGVRAVRLLAQSHELHVVTGRADFLKDATRRVAETYFPNCFTSIEFTNFTVSSTSGLKTRTKGEVCRELNANVLIDDHITHLTSILEAGVERAILFGNYAWNEHDSTNDTVVRCATWEDVTGEIHRFAGHELSKAR